MAFYAGLAPLRDVLADLYPAGSLARVVVAEAGIPEQLVDFGGAAIEVWQRVLGVAQGNGQVQALVDVARKHYPGNADLAEAERVWRTMPPPALPGGPEAAGGHPTGSGGNVTITVGGSNGGVVAGGGVSDTNVVSTGNITGDGNVIGMNRSERSDRKADT
jgi:hypothetical protein